MVRFVLSLIIVVAASSNASIMRANDGDARKVTEIINKVNRHWQHAHPEPGTAFGITPYIILATWKHGG